MSPQSGSDRPLVPAFALYRRNETGRRIVFSVFKNDMRCPESYPEPGRSRDVHGNVVLANHHPAPLHQWRSHQNPGARAPEGGILRPNSATAGEKTLVSSEKPRGSRREPSGEYKAMATTRGISQAYIYIYKTLASISMSLYRTTCRCFRRRQGLCQ